jgi:hypothetical protein
MLSSVFFSPQISQNCKLFFIFEQVQKKFEPIDKKLLYFLPKKLYLVTRVVDPYSFFTDPDPDPELMLEVNTDPDPNPDPDPDPNPIRIQGLNDQKLKKNYN